MLGRKPTIESQAVDFEKIKNYKVELELTGEIISVIQDLMMITIEERKVEYLVQHTSPGAVQSTFSFISDATTRMLATAGIDTEDSMRQLKDFIK